MELNKAIVLAACAMLTIGTAARAQDAQQAPATAAVKPENFQDWQLFCPEPSANADRHVCEIRTVAAGKDGRKLAALAVAAITETQTKKSEIIASALVPLGVDLRTGPALRIDNGNPVELSFIRCLQRGCEAMISLSPEQQASMQSGTKASVAVGVGASE